MSHRQVDTDQVIPEDEFIGYKATFISALCCHSELICPYKTKTSHPSFENKR